MGCNSYANETSVRFICLNFFGILLIVNSNFSLNPDDTFGPISII